ncbi:hypothetical protein ACFQRB_16750 [Halobaculum litoreum]|uniref:Transposase n=1 Tax=Halobaculum litoreum TaxID=3031998 RepID=A0ABD5XWT3_9EURY
MVDGDVLVLIELVVEWLAGGLGVVLEGKRLRSRQRSCHRRVRERIQRFGLTFERDWVEQRRQPVPVTWSVQDRSHRRP